MTSNLGASEILGLGSSKLGFSTSQESSEKDRIREKVMAEVKRSFKPEFLNRIDEIIVFDRLKKDEIKEIAKLMLSSLVKRLADNEITVTFTDSAVEKIADEGFDEVYGARPLRRAIQSKIEDMLSEKIIDGEIKSGESETVDVKDDEFVLAKN
jgi:ATP-dependent Clp protease ATP-binding subunit ClpC